MGMAARLSVDYRLAFYVLVPLAHAVEMDSRIRVKCVMMEIQYQEMDAQVVQSMLGGIAQSPSHLSAGSYQ